MEVFCDNEGGRTQTLLYRSGILRKSPAQMQGVSAVLRLQRHLQGVLSTQVPSAYERTALLQNAGQPAEGLPRTQAALAYYFALSQRGSTASLQLPADRGPREGVGAHQRAAVGT